MKIQLTYTFESEAELRAYCLSPPPWGRVPPEDVDRLSAEIHRRTQPDERDGERGEDGAAGRIETDAEQLQRPKPKPKPKPKKPRPPTPKQLQAAVLHAKRVHGDDFLLAALKLYGADPELNAAQQVAALAVSDRAEFLATLKAGPEIVDEPDPVLPGKPIEAEVVQDAIRAKVREIGQAKTRALMARHGIRAIPDVADMPDAARRALLDELIP